MAKTLDNLKNTDYTVEVTRKRVNESKFFYEVTVRKPIQRDPSMFLSTEYEIVGARTLSQDATKDRLETLVRTILDTDQPALDGTYVGETEEKIYGD